MALVAFASAACNNSNDSGSKTGTSGASGTTTTRTGSLIPGATAPTVGAESFLTIHKVLRSNQEPNSILEIIGLNGEIGTQCPNINECKCVFNWTENSGIVRESETPALRAETNMLRCSFSVVSPDVRQFDVRIKILAANQSSTTSRVFLSTSNPSLDPSLASNYLPVYRFMCRDMIVKRQNTQKYGTNLLDPSLWDLSLPYTFYTTSFGRDYGALSVPNGGGGVVQVTGYECPLIPNDISDNSIYDYRIFSLDPIDVNDPTRTNVTAGTGNNTIWPVDDDLGGTNCGTGSEATCEKFLINRHDYYLASFKSGTFKEPVCLNHKVGNIATGKIDCVTPPDTATSGPITLQHPQIANTGAPGQDIIGFAAVPDQNQRCPDPALIKLPPGKKWAKLWQFRTSYQQRTILDVANKGAIADLFCATRENECRTNTLAGSVCITSKNPKGGNNQGLGPMLGATLGGTFSDPGFGNCDQDGTAGDGKGDGAGGSYTGSGAPCVDTAVTPNFNCCQNDIGMTPTLPGQRPANHTPGGEWCNPALIGENDASSRAVGAHVAGGKNGVPGLGQDVWLMGNGTRRACIEADTDANGALAMTSFPPANPNPYILAPREIDAESRFDIMYVVTPERVNFEDMQDAENGKIARQYTPFRAKPNGAAGEMQKYTLFSNSQNTDQTQDRFSRYPLCIIQDAKRGITENSP